MYPSEPFPHFVDDYLAYLHEALPSYAGLDGVHAHDDLLEDLSRQAIDAHVRNIRRKIEADPHQPHHLLTVYGVGYRLADA